MERQMKTRIIHTKIWKDEWFSSLPRIGKLLFQFLLTNENVNMCGCYELNDKEIKLWLDFTDKELIEAKRSISQKAFFKNGWVRLLNHDKYNSYGKGEKQEVTLNKEISQIPEYMNDTSIDTSIDTQAILALNHNTEIINNKYKREDITKKVIEEISTKYSVPLSFVSSKFDDLCNWEDEKPGRMRGRNWKMTLMNWVKRDSAKITQEEKSHARRITVIPIR